MSARDPLTCGFLKVKVYNLLIKDTYELRNNACKKDIGEKFKSHCEEIGVFFGCLNSGAFNIESKQYKDLIPVQTIFRTLSQRHPAKKQTILETFSENEWARLERDEKEKHTPKHCKGCLSNRKFKHALSQFPISGQVYISIAKKHGLIKKPLCDITNNSSDKKKEELIQRKTVKEIEEIKKSTAVVRTFSTNQSKRTRQRSRLDESHESKKNAKIRTEKENELIAQGKKKRNTHGNIHNYKWKWRECLDHFYQLDEGSMVNFSQTARDFELFDKNGKSPLNGGQLVKQFLIKNGINLKKFNFVRDGPKSNTRRARQCLPDSNVKVPCEVTNDQLDELLREDIRKGKYTAGELLTPHQFEKHMKMKDGKIVIEDFSVQGRKITLKEIREKSIEEHKEFIRSFSDDLYDDPEWVNKEYKRIDEPILPPLSHKALADRLKEFHRTRLLFCWHDGSSISNHGHLLITISVIYDEAVFYTDDEYEKLNKGKQINVQSTVETPSVHLLARCPSSDEQLFYSDARLEELDTLSTETVNDNIKFRDVMRFFKGDGPACQTELGQQKGGNFFCWLCPIRADNSRNFSCCHNTKYLSYQDRIDHVTKTQTSKILSRKNKYNYYDRIKKPDIIGELTGRDVKFKSTQAKGDLQSIFDDTMHGAHRVPALLVNNPYSSIEDHNLSRYECLPVEPLHAITGHTKNLYEEIPYHLEGEDKDKFENYKKASFCGKEAKNGSDYRKSVVNLCSALKPTFPFYEVLSTLCEIQEILYHDESKRSVMSVLRLYNITYLHMIAIMNKIPIPKHLTSRRLFGQYYHSIIIHSPQQYRIINGISSNTEKEERLFSFLKSSSKLTSNHHADHVIYNALVRLQVLLAESKSSISYNPNEISINSKHLRKKVNTVFSHEHIRKHRSYFQSHLERIADYLLEGRVFWKETPLGIEFYDTNPVESSLHLHHFRSSTIKMEIEFVKHCWERCLEDADRLIPLRHVVVEDELENIWIIKPTTLTTPLPTEELFDFQPINTPSAQAPLQMTSTPLFPEYNPKRKHSASTLQPSTSKQSTDEENDTSPRLTKASVKLPKIKEKNLKKKFTNKTTLNLNTLFGPLAILSDYDRYRTMFKQNAKQYGETFKNISARLEVMVKSKYDNLKKEKKEIEDRLLREGGYSYKQIKDQSYLDIISKIKIAKALLKVF